ncbi:hypothetical protein [uncultured Draconibacterium sp.]|uniref:hypothetical protein n=1 Tax=uncultured Draconibacterium sp. TaxID=1573823 RepID=UPI0025F56735|nr:hypothetical protein [uncultured Draconibacterium sp.]
MKELLHTHPKYEKEVLMDNQHCIVDRKDVEQALSLITELREQIKQKTLQKLQLEEMYNEANDLLVQEGLREPAVKPNYKGA